ncbi:MAG: Flp family type IVb pilin [Sphingomicrobium sp.]
MRILRKLLSNTRGATAIEYALIASLISVAAIAAFNNLGNGVLGKFNTVNESM